MTKSLIATLKEIDWIEINEDWEYRKGSWVLHRDTSSWWQVGTDSNPRVFDVAEPSEYNIGWTANLIEHLCKMEDERTRLRKSLEQIQNVTKDIQTSEFAKTTLADCYHRWLVAKDKIYCPICNSTKDKE